MIVCVVSCHAMQDRNIIYDEFSLILRPARHNSMVSPEPSDCLRMQSVNDSAQESRQLDGGVRPFEV